MPSESSVLRSKHHGHKQQIRSYLLIKSMLISRASAGKSHRAIVAAILDQRVVSPAVVAGSLITSTDLISLGSTTTTLQVVTSAATARSIDTSGLVGSVIHALVVEIPAKRGVGVPSHHALDKLPLDRAVVHLARPSPRVRDVVLVAALDLVVV